jgi:mannose-1-phosphate guanylyltransferase/phosphomannomutase
MRAILIATGACNGAAPLMERYPNPLLPLVDRPFMQHVIEYLARQDIRRMDIVVSDRSRTIENYFGDGTRWGCRFTYHQADDPNLPYQPIRGLDVTGDGQVLLGHVDRLPTFVVSEFAELADDTLPLVTEDDSGKLEWTGWTVLSDDAAGKIDAGWKESDLANQLLRHTADRVVERMLDCRSFAALLESQRAVLAKEFAPVFLTGREVEPGIHLSRNVSLHPTAKLTAPVFIGENCHIGAGVQIGPHAVVGCGCILGRDSKVCRSLIFPDNYIGADLELDGVIIDSSRIHRCDGTVVEADALLVGSLCSAPENLPIVRSAGQIGKLVRSAWTAPANLLTALFGKFRQSGSDAMIPGDLASER